MMTIPDTAQILALLDQLEHCIADDLESQFLDFKPWQGPKEDLKLACEYAACFANADGGVVIFGDSRQSAWTDESYSGSQGVRLGRFSAWHFRWHAPWH